MTTKYHIITDTHFNHDKIIKYCQRPIDYETKIHAALSKLPADAILIHLGDICIGMDEHVHNRFIDTMICRTILVRGNHDKKTNSWYLDHGWDFVCDRFDDTLYGHKLAFTHRPIPWDGNFDLNIHGHLHNLGHRDDKTNHLNLLLSLELDGYAPISLEAFIGKKLKDPKISIKPQKTGD